MKKLKNIKLIILLNFIIGIIALNTTIYAAGIDDNLALVDYFDTKLETTVMSNVVKPVSSYKMDHDELATEQTILDYNNNLNFIYYDKNYIYIQKLNSNNKTDKIVKIERPSDLPYYGGITTDKRGNYYIAWGREDDKTTWQEASGVATLVISKYNSNGLFIKSYEFCDSMANFLGATKKPFDVGVCKMSVNDDGYLAYQYTLLAKTDHQTSKDGIIDTKTMEEATNYNSHMTTSHCFHQDVINYKKTGGFAYIVQGDGLPRAYAIGASYKWKNGIYDTKRIALFHFRPSGQMNMNYTFSNYGGIEEVDTGLALVASSEKTLDEKAQTSLNESRNVFIQIIKNDFLVKNEKDQPTLTENDFITKGTPRTSDKYTDYGIKWLTNYNNDFSAMNVKTVKVDNDRIAIFWMEAPMKTTGSSFYVSSLYENNDIYYMVVDNKGNIVYDKTLIPNASLPLHSKVVYKDGYVYFSNSDDTDNLRTYKLKLYEIDNTPKFEVNKDTQYVFKSLNEKIKFVPDLNNGKSATYTFKSSNEKVLKVDGSGDVTSLKPGFADIVIEDTTNGTKAIVYCYVQVLVNLSNGSKAYVGDMNRDGVFDASDSTLILEAYKREANSDEILIGDIDGNGVLDASDASQILEIFKSERFKPGIYYPITKISLNNTELELKKENKIVLKETLVAPKNTTDSLKVNWTSDNEKVATVDSNGNVEAKSSGIAKITATTTNNLKATCIVKVDYKFLLGDFDSNLKVDVTDAYLLLTSIAKNETLSSEKIEVVDMNTDKKVDVTDAYLLLKLISES